jgi:hypothetical protein
MMNNPFLRPVQPKQKKDPYATTMQAAPLALELYDIKKDGGFDWIGEGATKAYDWMLKGATPGEALPLTQPTVQTPEVGPSLAAPGTEPASATARTGAEGLDAFDLGQKAAEMPAYGNEIVSENTRALMEGLDAFDQAALTKPVADLALQESVDAGLAAGADVGMGAGEAAGEMSLGGTVVGPAMAGFGAPRMVDLIHKDSMENLGHNITGGLVKHAQTAKEVGSATVGGLAGALSGATAGAASTSWSGPGAIVGAVVGAIAGLFGAKVKGCIVISACCGTDSYEVQVARKFRDNHMTEEQLTGYYTLCIFLVPFIQRHGWFRKLVKRALVDRLVDYGEAFMGMKGHRRYVTSKIVTGAFLGLCRHVGRGVDTVLATQEV